MGSKSAPFTAYITKYWEARGILTTQAVVCEEVSGLMIQALGEGKTGMYFHGTNWFRSLPEAQEHVAGLILAKIKTTEKKLHKLKALIPMKMEPTSL